MKMIIYLLTSGFFLSACNNSGKPGAEKPPVADTAEKQKFFPVTAFLKGEIFNLKQSGINPLKYTTVKDHTDSAWIKIEELDTALREFLNPEIDSANLVSLFTEKSFLDQSINAITLTYEPSGILPHSMHLKRWDIYIDPKTNNVRRIYMVKETDNAKTLQLTWLSNQWCKIVAIITNEKGESKIEKEEKFILDF
ncbi:MAG: hypothetical protein JNM14_06225 [Ferruginibacter sp.]|nr:hypothetical protein [Ferruginibacter sp.]